MNEQNVSHELTCSSGRDYGCDWQQCGGWALPPISTVIFYRDNPSQVLIVVETVHDCDMTLQVWNSRNCSVR